MEFSIKDFFRKCDQIRWKLQIWSYLLKKIFNGKLHFWCSEWYFAIYARSVKSLHKMPQFHLISWCGNIVETHSFYTVSEMCALSECILSSS